MLENIIIWLIDLTNKLQDEEKLFIWFYACHLLLKIVLF